MAALWLGVSNGAFCQGDNVIRGGAGFGRFYGFRERRSVPQVSAGYGRRIAGPLEADLGLEVFSRPYGVAPANPAIKIRDTLFLIPAGLRLVSPVLRRRWRFAVGAGASVFVYDAGNSISGSYPSSRALGGHALVSASLALDGAGRLSLAATPRFTAFNRRGLLSRIFSLTGGVEWRF